MSNPAASALPIADADDLRLATSIRSGDEQAFLGLVERNHAALVRLAETFVSSRAVAEEVARESWLEVLKEIDRFEGRSSLRALIFRAVVTRARSRAETEGRGSAFVWGTGDEQEPSVDPNRFFPADHVWAYGWARPPGPWIEPQGADPPTGELLAAVERTIDALPPGQAAVIRLRDVEGLTSGEVCNVLELSEADQRVLLHRGRTKLRGALAACLEEEQT